MTTQNACFWDFVSDGWVKITLKPGQRGGLVWQFGEAGTVDFACLIPGHLEAGMVGKVAVTNN